MEEVMKFFGRGKKKLALVVGCNYPNAGPGLALEACHNDALAMHRTLVEKFGFKRDSIMLLLDKPGNVISTPTGARIKRELYSMIDRARSGDVLFFYFSGHGVEPKGVLKDGAIIASDENAITRADFRDMVSRVPTRASFTIMADSCFSGGLIDKELVQIGPRPSSSRVASPCIGKPKMIPYDYLLRRLSARTGLSHPDIGVHMLHLFGRDASLLFTVPGDRASKALKPDQGILLSASQPDERSYQMCPNDDGVYYSAFTNAFQMIVRKNSVRTLTNRRIVTMARDVFQQEGRVNQHPCLYCSDKNAYAVFLGRP